jgi:hypothetical protein
VLANKTLSSGIAKRNGIERCRTLRPLPTQAGAIPALSDAKKLHAILFLGSADKNISVYRF